MQERKETDSTDFEKIGVKTAMVGACVSLTPDRST